MSASLRTSHDDPDMIAHAIEPDHTDDIDSIVGDGYLETTFDREQLGSLHATVDDYLVNLQVAEQVIERTQTETMTSTEHTQPDNE